MTTQTIYLRQRGEGTKRGPWVEACLTGTSGVGGHPGELTGQVLEERVTGDLNTLAIRWDHGEGIAVYQVTSSRSSRPGSDVVEARALHYGLGRRG